MRDVVSIEQMLSVQGPVDAWGTGARPLKASLSFLHRASTSALGKIFKGVRAKWPKALDSSRKRIVGGEEWSQKRSSLVKLDYCHYPARGPVTLTIPTLELPRPAQLSLLS